MSTLTVTKEVFFFRNESYLLYSEKLKATVEDECFALVTE